MIALSKLSFFWLLFAITTVGVVSYFVALTINGVFGKDGFGTIGNMVVLTFGFFLGIIVTEHFQIVNVRSFQIATYAGLAGALATFTVLALIKMTIDRLR